MKTYILIIVLFLSVQLSFAQQDQVMHYLSRVPQSTYVSPAATPDFKFYIGMPALSSLYLGVHNNALNPTNLITKRSDDSLIVDTEKFISSLHKNNYLKFQLQEEILAFGFKAKKNYFTFSLSEKHHTQFNYPKDLFAFVLRGNLHEDYLGKDAVFSNFGINTTHYHELALGYSREVNSDLRIGGRFKVLLGVANIQTKQSDLTIHTATESGMHDLTVNSTLEVNTNLPEGLVSSWFDTDLNPDIDFASFAKSTKNMGFGVDLGATYKLNDKLQLAASVLDLGYISWNYAPYKIKYTADQASFTYSGFDIDKVFNKDETDTTDYMSELGDSLFNLFEITTVKEKYTTMLPSRLVVSGKYEITKNDIVGGTLLAEYSSKLIHPSLSLAYTRKVGKAIQATVCYSARNRNYANIGMGVAFTLGPVQLYMLSDNIYSLSSFNKFVLPSDPGEDNGSIPFPSNSKNMNFRFGMNLCFGYLGKIKDKANGSESVISSMVAGEKKMRKETKEAKVKTDSPKAKKEKEAKVKTDQPKDKKEKEVKVKDDNVTD